MTPRFLKGENIMKQPTMVYKYPGTMHVCNVTKDGFNYKIVDADEEGALDQAFQQGWFASTKDAKEAASAPTLTPVDNNAPPTRDELETKADELGIQYTDADEDELLQMMIEEALSNPMTKPKRKKKTKSKGEFL